MPDTPVGSKEEMCPCVMEVTWAGIASGDAQRWRVVTEEIQVSRMTDLVVNGKVVFGLSFMLLEA